MPPAPDPAAPPYGAVLFDLDGTLVDPAGGITGGIARALAAADLPVPAQACLDEMVGPKLADSLVSIAGVPEARLAEVIASYRAWYAAEGMALSRLYPGIPELLAGLRAAGVQLAVATQKPQPLAVTLLAHHGIDGCFEVIRGSHADETLMPGDAGYRPDKAAVVAAALEALEGVGTAVMVGDRHQDVNGARANGLGCIGVSWGFAPDGELAAAGAAAVVHSTQELAQLLGAAALEGCGTGAL